MQHLNHMDDSARAVFAALNIKRQLTMFQQDMSIADDSFVEPPVHIGIATGEIFQGVVGNYMRREVVNIGATFDLALVLMQVALKHYGRIYCDFRTKQLGSHLVDFTFVEHLELGHKLKNEAIFQPTASREGHDESIFRQVDEQLDTKLKELLDSKKNALA